MHKYVVDKLMNHLYKISRIDKWKFDKYILQVQSVACMAAATVRRTAGCATAVAKLKSLPLGSEAPDVLEILYKLLFITDFNATDPIKK